MGIKEIVIIKCTCDLCGKDCEPKDNHFRINLDTHAVDGGRPNISGNVYLNVPYGCSGGMVCRSCQKKWLQIYVDSL